MDAKKETKQLGDVRLEEAICEQDRLWTVVEAANFLGIVPGTLYRMVSEHRVPVIKLSARCIRFRRAELEQWIAERTVAADSKD
jgi:excisionase family DNA binding protein